MILSDAKKQLQQFATQTIASRFTSSLQSTLFWISYYERWSCKQHKCIIQSMDLFGGLYMTVILSSIKIGLGLLINVLNLHIVTKQCTLDWTSDHIFRPKKKPLIIFHSNFFFCFRRKCKSFLKLLHYGGAFMLFYIENVTNSYSFYRTFICDN